MKNIKLIGLKFYYCYIFDAITLIYDYMWYIVEGY